MPPDARPPRREAARKLKLFDFKSSFEDLMLTNPQQGVGNANAANMVHPAAAAALPGEPTGQMLLMPDQSLIIEEVAQC